MKITLNSVVSCFRPSIHAFGKRSILLLILMVLGSGSAFSQVVTMHQPTSVTTDMGNLSFVYGVDQITDQSNLFDPSIPLVTTYTSGVTEFASFAGSTTHLPVIQFTFSGWASADNTPLGVVSFDMGVTRTFSSIALWNFEANSFGVGGVRDFELLSDIDNDFSNGFVASLGSFSTTAPTPTSGGTVQAETFNFTPTNTRYIHMQISSNIGDEDKTGLGEVAFGGVVPEPSTYALLIGSACLLFVVLKRIRGNRQ